MPNPSICLIRKYEEKDKEHVKAIISDATMEKVNQFYFSAIFSDVLLKIVIVVMGISFVLLSVPFKYCLSSIPVGIVLLYFFIWTGHFIKANELHQDLNNIMANYMEHSSTCFFVAEFYGTSGEAELASIMNKVKKFDCDIYNEKEFSDASVNIEGLSRTIVGCVAITKSHFNINRAWLRRMAVKKEYRRRRIGTRLVLEAINFCRRSNYSGLDLLTTECHEEARQLYLNEGFQVAEVSPKSYLGFASGLSTRMVHTLESPTHEYPRQELSLHP